MTCETNPLRTSRCETWVCRYESMIKATCRVLGSSPTQNTAILPGIRAMQSWKLKLRSDFYFSRALHFSDKLQCLNHRLRCNSQHWTDMPQTRASRQNLSSTSTASEDDDRLTHTLLTLNILYQTHVHPHLPEPLQPVSKTISSLIISSAPYLSQLVALFKAVLSSASSLSSSGGSQDGTALLSLGLLLITLYMGLRIMNYIRRTIMGWVWLGIKLILVLFAVQIGVYINSYGWERALRDAGWLGGIVWGMLEDVLNDNQTGQQRQTRGTRRRGQSGYNYDDNTYRSGRGRGRYD